MCFNSYNEILPFGKPLNSFPVKEKYKTIKKIGMYPTSKKLKDRYIKKVKQY